MDDYDDSDDYVEFEDEWEEVVGLAPSVSAATAAPAAMAGAQDSDTVGAGDITIILGGLIG